MKTKGTFTSVWEDGSVTTSAVLDTDTGEVFADPANVPDLGCLEREYFTDEDEDEIEICPECHTYIMTTVMKDGIGKCLDEVDVCSNPECENR